MARGPSWFGWSPVVVVVVVSWAFVVAWLAIRAVIWLLERMGR